MAIPTPPAHGPTGKRGASLEPHIWEAIARLLVRPPQDPFQAKDYKIGQGDVLNLVKVSKAVFNAAAPILYEHVATHLPHSLVEGLVDGPTIDGLLTKKTLLARVRHLKLECGGFPSRGSYVDILANPLQAEHRDDIWYLVGEEVSLYSTYSVKPSDPRYMRHPLARAPLQRARAQLVSWTLFWQFVIAQGGFKGIFPNLAYISAADDSGAFDLTRRAELRWERIGSARSIAYASSLFAQALSLSPVANVCVGTSTTVSPMAPTGAIAMPRLTKKKPCTLTVHVQTAPRFGGPDDPVVRSLPFLVDGQTIWECNTMSAGSRHWSKMAVSFVGNTVRSTIKARAALCPLLSNTPYDISIYLPRVDTSDASAAFPGLGGLGGGGQRGEMNSFEGMMMMMGMNAQMQLLPGDIFGEALRNLSSALPRVYPEEGLQVIRRRDKLDIDLCGAWHGCKCCGWTPPQTGMQNEMMGMLSKIKYWRW